MRIESAHIDAERALSRDPGRGLMGEIEAIRAIADAQGNLPALSVLSIMDAALARGERRSLDEWVAIARDAIGCGRSDSATAQVFAAACSVRLAG